MNYKYIRSKSDFFGRATDEENSRISRIENEIAKDSLGKEKFHITGFCNICEKEVQFHGDWLYSDGKMPNYRERLVCEKCHLNNRQRFIAYLVKRQLKSLAGITPRIFCYEAVTAFYKWISSEYPSVVGSEFLGPNLPSGSIVNGIRHEDAMNLSFDDESMDLLVSQDVFEHVPDLVKSIHEVRRVLKPNGVILFSIPFHPMVDNSKQRAKIHDGEFEYLAEPLYHGNPIDSDGSLVFWDIAWDIFSLFEKDNIELEIIGGWSLEHGHLGGFLFVFKGTKKKY